MSKKNLKDEPMIDSDPDEDNEDDSMSESSSGSSDEQDQKSDSPLQKLIAEINSNPFDFSLYQ